MNTACKAASTSTTEYTEKDILNFLIQSSNIKLSDVEAAMKQAELERILKEKHPYAISQGKDGRYRTYINTDAGRKQIAKSTLEKLHIALYEHYTAKEERDYLKNITLKELYPKWLDYKSLHTDAATYITRINRDWQKYYQGTEIINIPVKKLDKITLDEWAHRLIKEHDMTNKMYYNCTVIMRQALFYAVDLGIIESSAFTSVRIDGRRLFRKEKKKDNTTQVFFKDEVKQIEELAWKDFQNNIMTVQKLAPLAVLFQFQTGIRVGELCAVRYEDIDWKNMRIHISRMFRYETGQVVEHTKGAYGDREVILTEKARGIINAARQKQQDMGLPTDGYIFSINDNPLPYDPVRYLYDKYCDEVGTVHKSSHKSRKTYISSLIDAGVNINTIREAVGHCDEQTTFRSYCFDRSTEDEKIARFEAALA